MSKLFINEDGVLYHYEGEDEHVVIPPEVRYIGMGVFRGNPKLRRVTVHGNVRGIDVSAFTGCKSLTRVELAEGLVSIGRSAFQNCPALREIVLPRSLRVIEKEAFARCTALTELVIPDGVTELGDGMLSGCTALTVCRLPKSAPVLPREMLAGCRLLAAIEIPRGVTRVETHCFRDCELLTEIELPATVTGMGREVFMGCKALAKVTACDDYRCGGAIDPFAGCPELRTFVVSEGVTSLVEGSFNHMETVTELVLPASLREIGDGAISDCPALLTLRLPQGLESIGMRAITDCPALDRVALPRSLNRVGEGAMGSCERLQKITLPDGHPDLAVVNGALIDRRRHLLVCYPAGRPDKRWTVPEGVTHIGSLAFAGNRLLEHLIVPESVTEIQRMAFQDSKLLRRVDLPGTLVRIGATAFMNCPLESLTIPDSVRELGGYALKGSGLRELVIPRSVTEIPMGLAEGCAELRRVTLHDGLTVVGQGAFAACPRLKHVDIPDGMTGKLYAFLDYDDRTGIRIRDIDRLPEELKLHAVLGFAAEGGDTSTPRGKAHLRAARSRMRRIREEISQWPELVSFLCRHDLIPIKSIPAFRKAAEDSGNLELQAMVMGYEARRLTPEVRSETDSRRAADEDMVADRAFSRMGRTDIEGMRFAVAGRIPDNPCVTDIKVLDRFLHTRSASLAAAVGPKVDFLVTDAPDDMNAKVAEANRLGIEIIGWKDFFIRAGIQVGPCMIFRRTLRRVNAAVSVLTVPEGVTCIPAGVFLPEAARAVTRIVLPDSATELDSLAFAGLPNLRAIVVSDTHPAFRSLSGVLYSRDMSRLICYPAGRTDPAYIIPASVTRIERHAFEAATALNDVVAPAWLAQIDWDAFAGCTQLRFPVLPPEVTAVGCQTYRDCVAMTEVDIPRHVQDLYPMAFAGCTGVRTIRLHDGLNGAENVFDGCSGVTEIIVEGDREASVRSLFDALGRSLGSDSVTGAQAPVTRVRAADPMWVPPMWRAQAVLDFALMAESIATPRGQAHLRYIRSHLHDLIPPAIRSPELMRLLCTHRLIPEGDIAAFREAAEENLDEARRSEISLLLTRYVWELKT